MTIKDSTEVDLSKFWDAVEWQGLKSLQSLEIMRCLKLKSLPEGMGGLTSLQKLEIIRCNKLKSLSEVMGSLASLQTLKIFKCHKLKSLPEGIQGICSHISVVNTGKFISVTTMMQKETGEDRTYILELEGGSHERAKQRTSQRLKSIQEDLTQLYGEFISYWLLADALRTITKGNKFKGACFFKPS
ncbi:putative disease resistance protein [Quercus suber]|uniref:Disease resistance protein n=1 Tax=Quercus suber TaxID=58331 RepID=A0AAW0ITJ4_QUESU